MGETKIRWTDVTWNPTRGCSIVSPGCKNCYAMRVAATRLSGPGRPYDGLARVVNGHPVWTGDILLVPAKLREPIALEKRAIRTGERVMVFVDSMSDLFHEKIPFDFVDQVFDVMERCPHVVFQVLTKRPERMREYMYRRMHLHGFRKNYTFDDSAHRDHQAHAWAARDLPNIWLGTSVEDQVRADERIPLLIETPAAVRFLSCEPLLAPVDLGQWLHPTDALWQCSGCGRRCSDEHLLPWKRGMSYDHCACPHCGRLGYLTGSFRKGSDLHWIIVGGESGPGHRPMNPQWARDLLDQCRTAEVPFFFKQMGGARTETGQELDGKRWEQFPQVRELVSA